MKKRVIALMLAFVLVLNMGTVAFANGEATPAPVTETEPTPTQEVEATLTPAPIAEAPSPVAEVIPTPTSEVVLESISVTQTPDKLEYLCTDTVVDSTGGLLTLTFSDRTTQTVDLSVATLSLVKETVNVTYEGMTDSFAVTVSHNYDEGTVTTEATATEPGVMTYTCADCGDEQIGEIPMAVATEIASGTCGAEGDNLTWTLDSDGVLTISGTGEMAHSYSAEQVPWNKYCDDIKTVIIEDGVTSISGYAFAYCRELNAVKLPDSLTDITYDAFLDCDELVTITIPDSVRYIGEGAFCGCDKLIDFKLPYCLDEIRGQVFGYCTALTDIELPYGISSIHWSAFEGCSGLKSITIPASVASIHTSAFKKCTELTSILFEGDAPEISEDAFTDVAATAQYFNTREWVEDDFKDYGGEIEWEAIDAPQTDGDPDVIIDGGECGDNLAWSLSETGALTISGTGAMFNYSASGMAPWGKYREAITEIVLPEGLTCIGDYAFAGCGEVKQIIIPDGVTMIGGGAFANCVGLIYVRVPKSAIEIGYSYGEDGIHHYTIESFVGCRRLTTAGPIGSGCNIEFGWDEVIPNYAFSGCGKLKSIHIPKGITRINSAAFENNHSLESITVDADNTVYTSIDGVLFKDEIMLVKYPQNKPETHYSIPDNTRIIYADAFSQCFNLKEIKLNEGLTQIRSHAFVDCELLTEIIIPGSINSIGNFVFGDCGNLTKVYFEGDAPAIAEDAFGNVIATAYYYKTKNWAEDDFQHYEGTLTWVEIDNEIASGTCGAEGDNLTWTLDSEGILTISGTGAMKDYPNEIGAPWADFADDLTKVVIEEGITTIGASAFMYCGNLTEVVIPGTVTSIGSTAFLGCTSLTKFDIPEGVISVGGEAFGECNALERINIPSSLTSFGERMFINGAGKLTEINVDSGNTVYSSKEGVLYSKDGSTLVCYPCGKEDSSYIVPEGVTAIGNSAFEDCNVTQVQLPDTLTRIGADAFMNCQLLKTVNIPNGVSTIESGAFSCGITSVNIPASVTEMESAFRESYALTEITVDSGNPNYMSKDGVLFSKDGKELICYPDRKADAEYTVPDGVVTIIASAFGDTRNLKKVTISGSVKTIEEYVFTSMNSTLEEVVLSEGLEVIDDGAFSWCGGLTSITIPASVTKIGERAFIGSGLTGISFKGDALQIADNAFTNVTATVKYLHTKNWPEDKLQDYGGTLTWQLCCENFEECEVIKDEAVEPTFDSTGLTEGSHCSVCEKPIVAQNELPKLAVTELEITAPDKLVYYKGESLDSTGLTVTAKLNNDTNIDVTDQVQLEGFSSNAAGTKTITVSFKDAQATFDVQVFSFTSVSLSLEGRVIINFYANFPDYAEAGYTPGILFFRKQPDGDEIVAAYNAGEGVTSYVVADNGALMFSYDKLAAKELNDKVYATLYAVQDDGKVVFGTPTPISAAEYAISTFGLYANDARLQTLMVDMLNFGAAAQNEFDYRTDALANSNMSATMAAKATKDNVSLSNGMKLYDDGLSSDKVTIKSASLSLDNEISINFYAEIKGDIKKAELLIFDEYTAGGVYDKNTYSKRTDMVPHEDMYAGFITGIAAKSMRDLYYARVYVQFEDGTEAYSGIGQYSVESYAWQVRNGSGFSSELKLLMEEMMKYGDSAKMYMENKNNNANG